MEIYLFDDSGRFIGTQNAQKDPIKREYVFPPNSTTQKPPKDKEGFSVIFLNDKWEFQKNMSESEKILNGIIPIPIGKKILNEQIIDLSDEELLELKLITKTDYQTRRKIKLQTEIDIIERQAIRPIMSILAGSSTSDDINKIKELEDKKRILRDQLIES